MAGEGHEAAHALGDGVVAGALGMRPCLTEAGDRDVHHGRIDRAHRLVAQPELGRHPGQEVLHHDVRPLGQLEGDLGALGPLKVEGDAPLVPVDGGERRAHAVLAAENAQVVAERRPLDLDDVGAEVGEEGGAVRSRDHPREVEDADAFEHAHAAGTARPRAHSRRESTSSARVTESGLVALISSRMCSVASSAPRANAV